MGQGNFRKAPVEHSKFFLFAQQFNLNTLLPAEAELFAQLEEIRLRLGFPAVSADIGALLCFLTRACRPKVVFEFGSGYGQSAFWFLAANASIKKIFLTEKMKSLRPIYETISWPKAWRKKMQMHWGDAFEALDGIKERIDLVLMDGQKRDYLRFLKCLESKLKAGAIVVIDNAFFKGSLWDPKLASTKKSVQALQELHRDLATSPHWEAILLAVDDGIFLLRKKTD